MAMNSGWDAFVNDAKFRNADDDGVMHFPGFHVEAAQMLLEETGAIGIAVDTLSLDHGPSPDFATHYEWLPTNRWGLECIANLDALPRPAPRSSLGRRRSGAAQAGRHASSPCCDGTAMLCARRSDPAMRDRWRPGPTSRNPLTRYESRRIHALVINLKTLLFRKTVYLDRR